MAPSAAHGDAFRSTSATRRRAVATGLLATGIGLLAAPALARTAPLAAPLADPRPEAPIPDEAARIVSNLFTRMAVKTEVNDRAGLAFVMDTGAGRTAIARDLAEALALPPGPPILVHGLTAAELTPTVRIARMSFGGRRFTNIHAGVYPRELLGADGLMGLDVLSRFELAFDLDRRSMTVTASDRIGFSTGVLNPTRLRNDDCGRTRTGRFGQMILVNAHVDGVQVDCFIDSGAQYSIGNLALLQAVAPGADLRQDVQVQVHGVTGQTILAEHRDVGQLVIGSRRLGPTSLLFADLHAFEALDLIQRPALLLGADVLYRFRRVSLDFGRSRMAFGPVRRTVDTMTRR